MEKSLKKTSLFFDVHSLITVRAPDMPDQVGNTLIKQLKLFISDLDTKSDHVLNADIVMLMRKPDRSLELPKNDTNTNYGFWITEYNGEQAIIFTYRNKPDIIVTISHLIKIFYVNRPRVAGKLYSILLFCFHLALYKKNGLLFHGAVATKKDNCVVLLGSRGSKKTMFLLSMLKDGWDYLSEDKFILHNNRAYIFQSSTPLRDQHFLLLPWLANLLPDSAKLKKKLEFRKWARTVFFKYAPQYLLHPMKKYYNPSITIDVNKLFPDSKVISSAKPSIIIMISSGNQFDFKSVSRGSIIGEINTLHHLIMNAISQELIPLLFLYNQNYKYDFETIVNSSFSDQQFFKLTIPVNSDMENIYKDFTSCLNQVL